MTFNRTIAGKSGYEYCTIQLQNTYTTEQNAHFVLNSITENATNMAIYINTEGIAQNITSNSLEVILLNFGVGGGTCTLNYSIIGIPTELLED